MSSERRADPLFPIPADFDRAVEWFEETSTSLVLLAEYPLTEVEGAIRSFASRVRDHLGESSPRIDATEPPPGILRETRALLRSDHAWFSTSIDQLDWFYRIVAAEDHGGHRQALGQYGRILAESLRRHRSDERAYLAAAGASRRPAGPPAAKQR